MSRKQTPFARFSEPIGFGAFHASTRNKKIWTPRPQAAVIKAPITCQANKKIKMSTNGWRGSHHQSFYFRYELHYFRSFEKIEEIASDDLCKHLLGTAGT